MKNTQQDGNSQGNGCPLSRRGRALAEIHPFPTYLQEHFTRVGSRYDAQNNPSGYIDLCIAENKLVWPLLNPNYKHGARYPIVHCVTTP